MSETREKLGPSRLGPWRLRTCLLALVLVTLVPAMGVAAYAIWRSAQSYQEASAMRMNDAVRTLARAVEGDLLGRLDLMNTLAHAPSAGRLTPSGLRAWVSRSGAMPGADFHVEDLPAGASTTSVGLLPAVAEQALLRRQAVLSNLLPATAQRSAKAAIVVPYGDEAGHERRVLTLLLSPQRLLTIAAQQQGAEQSLLVAVTDGNGRIVARSRDIEKFAGQPVPDWDKLLALGTDHGIFQARTKEGRTVVLSFQRLAGTPGWTVVVGEPLEAFAARSRSTGLQMAAGGGSVLLLSCLLALWLARQLERPVRRLMRNAHDVVASSERAPAETQAARRGVLKVLEFESLAHSIDAAEEALRQRAEAARQSAEALARRELRYRTLAQSGAVVLWRAAADGSVLAAGGWQVLTGRPESEALGHGWLRLIHSMDRSALRAALLSATNTPAALDTEVRLDLGAGRWRWVRIRGTVVPADKEAPAEWVGVVEDVDDKRQAQQKMAHMALHDALTGLPNRVRFREQLESAIQHASRGQQGAVLYIDLDRFKLVNDTLGHPAGDALLQAVTERLLALVRDTDLVARLGGDEFAIVQSQVATAHDAAQLVSRLVDALSAPYELRGQQVVIGASVGVMLISCGTLDADVLLKNADIALYRAKQDGRGRHCFFEPELDADVQRRHQLETDLRQAVAMGQLRLRYQLMMNSEQGGSHGFEATLQWLHPQWGEQGEDTVLALAAETGLSDELAEWMLERACGDAMGWAKQARVAVNLSASQWLSPGLPERLESQLQRSGLAPARLELEIDESMLQNKPDEALEALRRIKPLGVRIVLDRFASRASSIGLLTDFPFDKVKIERRLVQSASERPAATVVVSGLIRLCRSIGAIVGADGIDTRRHLDALAPHRDTEIQGDVLGGPRTADEVAALCSDFAQGGAEARG